MALSTRQLADLAGTTLKTVRHYHDIGLLDLPDRSSNGYKQYTVDHLVRVLQVKRLSDLGVALSLIPPMSAEDPDLEQTLRALDLQIEADIERLQVVRSELRGILRDCTPVDVPAEFASVSPGLSQSDRALLMVYSRVLSEDKLRAVRSMLLHRDPLDDEYDALPADADEDTMQSLAERYAPSMRRQLAEHPWMSDSVVYGPDGEADAQNIEGEAVLALYNAAQQSVRRRIHLIVQQQNAVEADDATGETDGSPSST